MYHWFWSWLYTRLNHAPWTHLLLNIDLQMLGLILSQFTCILYCMLIYYIFGLFFIAQLKWQTDIHICVSTHTHKINICVQASPYQYGNPYLYGELFFDTVWVLLNISPHTGMIRVYYRYERRIWKPHMQTKTVHLQILKLKTIRVYIL